MTTAREALRDLVDEFEAHAKAGGECSTLECRYAQVLAALAGVISTTPEDHEDIVNGVLLSKVEDLKARWRRHVAST